MNFSETLAPTLDGGRSFLCSRISWMLLVAVFAVVLSGCAVGAAISYGVVATEVDNFAGTIEVGDIKIKTGADIAFIKGTINTATISSTVFNKDMTEPNSAPRPSDTKINAVVTEEAKRSLGISGGSSSVVVRVKTFYFDEGYPWGYYYWGGVTEKDTLSYYQKTSVRKAINAHFTVEKGNDILLEVHGLWGGNDKADEIAGARQLAREVASEVIKKLSASSAPPPASVAEAETPKR